MHRIHNNLFLKGTQRICNPSYTVQQSAKKKEQIQKKWFAWENDRQLRMSTLIRGHSLPLRLTIPPLRTPQGFACSVASLSRCPYHYPPGHHSLRHAALVECPLGQGKPSTWPEGHEESTYTSPTSFHLDDRKAQPFPAVRSMKMKC